MVLSNRVTCITAVHSASCFVLLWLLNVTCCYVRVNMVRGIWSDELQMPIMLHVKFRARGYKTFFVLNSVEHEISNAH